MSNRFRVKLSVNVQFIIRLGVKGRVLMSFEVSD